MCLFCNQGVQKCEEIICSTCNKIAHQSCAGLNMPIKGHVLWNCMECGPHSLKMLTAIVLELKNKLLSLEEIPDQISSLKQEIKVLKPNYSAVLQRNTQNERVLPAAFSKSGSGIFDMGVPNQNKNLYNTFRGRINSTTSSKRQKPDEDEDTVITDDLPIRNRMKVRKQNFGAKQSQNDFNGIKKKPSRRHIFLGRLNSNCTEGMIKNWCSEGGAKVLYLREITKEGSKLKSFHLVSKEDAHELIQLDNFWPSTWAFLPK